MAEVVLSKRRGALNEVEAGSFSRASVTPEMNVMNAPQQAMLAAATTDYAEAHAPTATRRMTVTNYAEPLRYGWFTVLIEEGGRALVTDSDGTGRIVVGPARVWRFGRRFRSLQRFVAHPGDFLVVRRRDGTQHHVAGPADVWFDPREHAAIEVQEVMRLDAKEAVVVYAKGDDGEVARRLVHGPATFVPEPGEWLHTFSWHGSRWSGSRYLKVPNALEFQKLWLMPDQMYHDVPDVRTADDALLTVRLMVFFELRDIEAMLEGTHDPIGDFVNAATSDVIDWVGRYDFEGFKRNTEALNELSTYRQLASRAAQCGYVIHKVVYRGYGATTALQKMHDEAIESRTQLQLERATQLQAQELEDTRLDREHARGARRRAEEAAAAGHDLDLKRRRQEAELADAEVRRAFDRAQRERDFEAQLREETSRKAAEQAHLEALGRLGVDLTRVLTDRRPDRIVEVRGEGAHVHVDGGR